MSFNKIKNLEIFKWSLEMVAIGNRGVQLAIEENEKLGLPSVFSIKHKIYYKMPGGTSPLKVLSRK